MGAHRHRCTEMGAQTPPREVRRGEEGGGGDIGVHRHRYTEIGTQTERKARRGEEGGGGGGEVERENQRGRRREK